MPRSILRITANRVLRIGEDGRNPSHPSSEARLHSWYYPNPIRSSARVPARADNGGGSMSAQSVSTAVLRGCRNQKASEMEVCTPWSFIPNIPAETMRDKAAFRSWAAEKTTDHLFYSASEGICST